MSALRHLLHRHAAAAWAVLALAAAMRLLVPIGFMPSFADGRIGLIVCTGMAPAADAMPAMAASKAMPGMARAHAMPGMAHGRHDGQPAPDKSDTVCPFAALGLAGIAGADPIALAPPPPALAPAAVALPLAFAVRAIAYLRPPSQGPPRAA